MWTTSSMHGPVMTYGGISHSVKVNLFSSLCHFAGTFNMYCQFKNGCLFSSEFVLQKLPIDLRILVQNSQKNESTQIIYVNL